MAVKTEQINDFAKERIEEPLLVEKSKNGFFSRVFSKLTFRKKKNFEGELKEIHRRASEELIGEPVVKDSKITSLGIAFLRIGMAIVFLYFGISQLLHPERFIGWLPKEVSLVPLAPKIIVILNGSLEVFCGTLILFGIYTRLASLIMGLHLAGITFTIGFTEIGVRDFGLVIATLALVFTGPGAFSLGNYLKGED